MASYLWLRGQTWFFQIRPPNDLKPMLGSSPFRVRLPVQSNRVASRYARHLAGWAERWFSLMRYRGFNRLRIHTAEGDESWTEEEYRESQAAIRQRFTDFLLAEVQRINRDAIELEDIDRRMKSSESTEPSVVAEKQKHLFEKVHAGWNEFAKTLIEDYDNVFTDLQSNSRAFRSTKQDLEDLNENYKDDFHDWKDRVSQASAKASKFEADFHAANKKSTRLLGKVEIALDGNKKIQEELLYKGPLLSECFEEFIETKTKQLPSDSREPAYFKHRLNAFIRLVADKRIADYDIQDLNDFAEKLQYLPKRHTVDPKWRGMTLEDAIAANKKISEDDREESLSYGTARVGYIGKIKTAIRWLCAKHKVRYPFDYRYVHIPKGMPLPEDRYPLSKDQLNALFRECTRDATLKRPDDVWLPLLGYLTGARLGELVGLRTQDVKLVDGVWTGRLSARVESEKSLALSNRKRKRAHKRGRKNRQVKNPDSIRRFALHQKFEDFGFIDWVDRQRDEGHIYLFPELHDKVQRPSGAASKRMQRLFETLEMDSEYVFHSLRHNFKDWTRGGKVDERTIALQAGHSLEGVALNYGSKILTPKELLEIASLPIEKGVDLDVFKDVFVKTSRNPYRKKPTPALIREMADEVQSDSSDISKIAERPSRPTVRDDGEEAISVRKLRSDLGMSQKEFATAYGFSCGAVRDWEQGRTKPGYSARSRLYEIVRDPERMMSSRSGWPDS
ncbi:tyrosine-type recombinase/integrase [Tardiphaga sp.]|uniref:tyrosine-type recombinase/integrase n=1 Tax=Tardiphaga sp. TaxID=1926292 RepID=UPI002602A967|nr:tyrosine-type recombinase/integrase [Tardiphaga sp.]MDB5620368.1 hypothetical protein [Tardiphaga sp.]